MTTQNNFDSKKLQQKQWVAGAILIAIGLLILVGQWLQSDVLGMLIPAGLGLIFLAWGTATRNPGLLVPGGILSGIGLGIILVTGPFAGAADETQGAAFLLAFSAGWALITILTALLTHKTAWWPLIPGAVMAAVGIALLAGETGARFLALVNLAWPVALIAIGLYLILWRRGLRSDS